MAAVLRTVNIPARHGRSNFRGRSHSRPEFFTVGRNLAHGDDPYNSWIRLGHNNVPISQIFLSNAGLASRIDAPRPRRGMTVSETASFNASRNMAQLAVRHKTDYLLKMRCRDRARRRRLHNSEVWDKLHEYYSDVRIRTINTECDRAIAAIAGGCRAI